MSGMHNIGNCSDLLAQCQVCPTFKGLIILSVQGATATASNNGVMSGIGT